jgi:predicted secreted protein
VTRFLRDHREQQDAQLAVIEKAPASFAAAMVVMIMVVVSAVMARMLIAVVVVTVVVVTKTKSVFESHVEPNFCLNFSGEFLGLNSWFEFLGELLCWELTATI